MSKFSAAPPNKAAFLTTANVQQTLSQIFSQAAVAADAIDQAVAGSTTFASDHVHTRVMNLSSLINTFNDYTLDADVGAFIRLIYDDPNFDAGGLKSDIGTAIEAIVVWVANNYVAQPPEVYRDAQDNNKLKWRPAQVDPADFAGLRTLLGNLLALSD